MQTFLGDLPVNPLGFMHVAVHVHQTLMAHAKCLQRLQGSSGDVCQSEE